MERCWIIYKRSSDYQRNKVRYLNLLTFVRGIKEAILSINEKGVAVSDHHVEISNKINNEIVKTLDNWLKAKDVDRKKVRTNFTLKH